MKNFRKAFSFILSVSIFSVLVLSGCGEEVPEHDDSLYLNQSVYNLFGTESFRYAFAVDMMVPNMSVPGAGEGDVSVDFSMNGALSNLDVDEAGGEMTMVVKVSVPDESDYRFDLSVKGVGGYVYVKLLSVPAIPNFPVELVEGLVGTWWQVESGIADDTDFNMESFGGFGKNESEITDLERAERELILGAEFFSEIEFIGTESVNHDDAYGYRVVSDRQGIEDFITKLAELRGEEVELGAVVPAGMLEFLYYMDFDFDVFVDIATSTLVSVSGSATLTDPSTNELTELELDVSFSDLDQPFHIEAPVDYEVFDLGAFFGGFVEESAIGEMGVLEEGNSMIDVGTE